MIGTFRCPECYKERRTDAAPTCIACNILMVPVGRAAGASPTALGDAMSERARHSDSSLTVERYLQRTPRQYFCRSCGTCVNSIYVPVGWYLVQRVRAYPEQEINTRTDTPKHIRLGMYCSAGCLAAGIPRMDGIEREVSDRLETVAGSRAMLIKRGKLQPR